MRLETTTSDTDADRGSEGRHPGDVPELLGLLIAISKATRALLRLKLAELGFDPRQEEVLLAIDAFRPSSIGELANRLDLRASAASAAADNLLKRGLVTCSGNPHDSRQTIILITPAGTEAKMKLETMRRQIEQGLSASLSPAQTSMMMAQLVVAERQLRYQFAL